MNPFANYVDLFVGRDTRANSVPMESEFALIIH
jgi:hypothetical protein